MRAVSHLTMVIERTCEEINEDGSFLSEIQIRSRYHRHMSEQCTIDNPESGYTDLFTCGKRGKCGILPGDTIFWVDGGLGAPGGGGFFYTHFEPQQHRRSYFRGAFFTLCLNLGLHSIDGRRQQKGLEIQAVQMDDRISEWLLVYYDITPDYLI